jgi:hypothetical protein
MKWRRSWTKGRMWRGRERGREREREREMEEPLIFLSFV